MDEMVCLLLGLGALCILFVIPVIILVRVSGVSRGVDDLQRRIMNLERALAKKPGPVEKTEAPPEKGRPVSAHPAEPAHPLPPAPPCEPPLPAASAPVNREAPPSLPPLPQPATPSSAGEPTAFERAVTKAWNWIVIGEEFRKPGESWEYAVATNWLLRIGIVVVLAGVAFFLKYSIEKGLMGPLGRVALSLGAGVVLIVCGVRLLFKRYHLLGQGLTGAGFVMLYFAFYAASGMYHLMPNGAAFAMMACVTVAAGVLAVYYQSLLIAVLGLVGGYATPVMLGGSSTNDLYFYGYVLLVSCGVLGVSLVRRWPMLNVLGMLASYGLAFLYCEHRHGSEQLMRALLFLSAIHLLYLLSVVVIHIRNRMASGAVTWASIFINAVLFWTWAFILFQPVFGKQETGVVSLAVAAVYVALVYVCLRRRLDDQPLVAIFIALAAVFLAMSPVLMFSGEWLTIAWCLQALAMLWLSHKTGQTFLFKAAAALILLACARGLTVDLIRLYSDTHPWLLKDAAFWHAAGKRLLTCGVLTATLLTAWRLERARACAGKVLAVVLVQVWLYLTLEAHLMARVFLPEFRSGAVTLVWTCYAFALLFAGIRLRGKWMRWCGLALFGLAVFKLLMHDLEGLDSLYRIIAFVAVGVLLVLGSFVYLKYRSLFAPEGEEADQKPEVRA